MSKLNLHIYPSPFKFESRILRETKSIIDFDLAEKVIIASTWSEGLSEFELIDENRSVKRFKLFFDRFKKNSFVSVLKYFEFILKVFFFYKSKKVKIINCHSLFVLPIGYLLKLLNSGIWLIYDAHELESEKAGLNVFSKRISSLLETLLITKVNKVIVVGPSIGKWYQKKYNLDEVIVIRNVPEHIDKINRSRIFNETFKIPENEIIFIYQGLICKGRGIEIAMDAFKQKNIDKHLIIMGYGPLTELVKKISEQYTNIHFLPAVSPKDIPYYTSGADVGFSMPENICLSYFFGLSNKFFEYLNCGLPVIVSNFPDMEEIVKQFECGWSTVVTTESLTKLIKTISTELIKEKREGVLNARVQLNWEKESLLLLRAFPNTQQS